MKQAILILLSGILFLSACGQAPSATQTTPTSIIEQATSTPSPLPTSTQTLIPSPTLTASITPLPTIPTFTPTFDARTIVTVTPALKAECPATSEDVSINLTNFRDYYPELITALNQGASIETIVSAFEKQFDQHNFPDGNIIYHEKIKYERVDVTNDGVPEILLPGNSTPQVTAIILGCNGGQYAILYSHKYQMEYMYLIPVDANQNGITEVIIGEESGTSTGAWFELSIIEWHKGSFQEILTNAGSSNAFQAVKIEDIDNDKTKEIYWRFSEYIFSLPPWRRGTVIYKWNGEEFVPLPLKYDQPQFRFQSIQDGDTASLNGNFVDAEKAYQEAVFNKRLEWWSSQRQSDTIFKFGHEGMSAVGTPAPGNPDSAEYPRLAAYAYYRIMLLHLVQNQESEASTTYNTLQQKFGNDPYGHPYAEMATAFWEAYQSTHKMYDGCAAAIQYAVEHPEILTPLGSDYHGAQSHTYVPADVCPFR